MVRCILAPVCWRTFLFFCPHIWQSHWWCWWVKIQKCLCSHPWLSSHTCSSGIWVPPWLGCLIADCKTAFGEQVQDLRLVYQHCAPMISFSFPSDFIICEEACFKNAVGCWALNERLVKNSRWVPCSDSSLLLVICRILIQKALHKQQFHIIGKGNVFLYSFFLGRDGSLSHSGLNIVLHSFGLQQFHWFCRSYAMSSTVSENQILLLCGKSWNYFKLMFYT